jgi:hypothetical protein
VIENTGDLLELTALSRARRTHAGPVLVHDVIGPVRWPVTSGATARPDRFAPRRAL